MRLNRALLRAISHIEEDSYTDSLDCQQSLTIETYDEVVLARVGVAVCEWCV